MQLGFELLHNSPPLQLSVPLIWLLKHSLHLLGGGLYELSLVFTRLWRKPGRLWYRERCALFVHFVFYCCMRLERDIPVHFYLGASRNCFRSNSIINFRALGGS